MDVYTWEGLQNSSCSSSAEICALPRLLTLPRLGDLEARRQDACRDLLKPLSAGFEHALVEPVAVDS